MRLSRRESRYRPIRVFLFLILLAASSWALTKNLLKLSTQSLPGGNRLVIEASFPLNCNLERNGRFLSVHIQAKSSFQIQQSGVESGLIKSISWSKGSEGYTLIVEVQEAGFREEAKVQDDLRQIAIDILAEGVQQASPSSSAPASGPEQQKQTPEKKPPEEKKPQEPAVESKKAADPPALSEVEQETEPGPPEGVFPPPLSPKKIKTIVIDPGHGGLETGAKGKFGTLEKDVTLAVSLKLKALVENKMAIRVVLARDKDIDVSLDSRTAIANNNKADLFISIHANGSYQKSAHGSETFFLSASAPDEETRKLAYMENNGRELEGRIEKEEQDEVKLILWDLAQAAYLKESSRLAEFIQNDLNELLGTANRGVKQAPFKVLTGVACPAVLVEIAFISNPEEEKELVDESFQNRVVEAIYRGLQSYFKLYR